MKARYQFRFYPTDQQQQLLAQLFGCVRVVWNDALAICKQSKKLPSNNDLQKLVITQAKKTNPLKRQESPRLQPGEYFNIILLALNID
ncbi:helix-turn-helix domain-containing protein [Nostoc sp.]|uniref:helix-turn-helix domain-containing protein n=1 Tax=Nostoc sp. TaxID=1180 RepID=UPI002FFAF797